MKKIKLSFEHNLTPFHEKCLLEMLRSTADAFRIHWKVRSKKEFHIFFEFPEEKTSND